MLQLIAESGSTKSDWLLFDESGIRERFSTTGFNADIRPMAEIETLLRRELHERKLMPEKVFMYAASMANHNSAKALEEVLERIWPDAFIEVEHDLLAAARAACLHEPGIACILGTGSNSCLFDGKDIVREIGGQGYLFGDEGSGAHLGKSLMRKMLNGYFPDDLVQMICDWKGMEKLDIRKEAYQSEKPNVYLSQFSIFISENINRPEIKLLVKECMLDFLRETVMRYHEYQTHKVNFVGSVADTYREILLEACAEMKVDAGRIVKSPGDELVKFHQSK